MSESVRAIEEELTTAPILVIPSNNRCFVVYIDASLMGVRGVLMQMQRVMTYASRKLQIYEQNYPTHDLDLVVVVFTLKVWRHYLYGVQFELFTDHKSLR